MMISIGIVALNEENYLPNLLDDIQRQGYPHNQMEIVFVDSGSSDQTRKYMEAFKAKSDFFDVQILENKKRILASGWNEAIRNFKGDVLIRVDAHARIPENFVSSNVQVLDGGEMVCGGPRPNIILDSSPWKETLLQAEQSMFGSGIATFRNSKKRAYVKSVFHGAYRREVLKKVGYLNEMLGRTEDNEFNYRIRNAGYKICYSPTIISYQYARADLLSMLKQKFGNGYWVMLTTKVCPKCLSLFYFVPFVFVLSIFFTTILCFFGFPFLSIFMWSLYWSLAIAMAILSVRGKKKYWQFFCLPVLFFLLHISYGLGSFIALFKMPFWPSNKE